jgi:hypothetical protein
MTATAMMLSDDPLKGKQVSAFFSTHPPTTERVQQIQKNIDTVLIPRAQSTTNTAAFDEVKARLKK